MSLVYFILQFISMVCMYMKNVKYGKRGKIGQEREREKAGNIQSPRMLSPRVQTRLQQQPN